MAEQMTAEDIAAEIERRENQPTLAQLKAARAFHEFVASNPSWFDCSENVTTLVAFMERNELLPSVENYDLGFAACDAAGLLLAPGESEDVIPEPEMTLNEIDAMPSGEYRQRLNDAKFVELVNRLESQKPKTVWRGRVRT